MRITRPSSQLSGIESKNIKNWEALAVTAPADTSLEIYNNSVGSSIYFPYSENFAFQFTPTYFNNLNTDPWGSLATIIPADREADAAPGQQPYKYKRTDGANIIWEIRYRAVTINDTYAANNVTHIVGVGIEPNKNDYTMPIAPNPGINVVFLGDFKATKHFDRLISLTGNGGGSEYRVIRGDNFLQQNDNGQITSPQNVIPVDIKRKNKDKWIAVNSMWDTDWEANNTQQIFGIYEEDTEGTKTFSGSLQTTLTAPGGTGTIVGNRAFSITVKSQDPILRQLEWNRTSFYQFNAGGLNNGCGLRGIWTIYDCNQSVMYTLPQQ